MTFPLRSITLLVLMGTATVTVYGQEDAEYRMEYGVGVGTSFYMGDANNTFYSQQKAAFAGLWRYLFDHHNVLKVALSIGGIKGQVSPDINYYPVDLSSGAASSVPSRYRFSGTVYDLSCLYELNFWPYGYYTGYMGYKRLTPYIQAGLGLTYSSAGKTASANIPIGVGLKYRLGKRWNIALDWTYHFALSDKLDDYQDPLGIKSEVFKNKDNYCLTMLTLTYNISPICPNCNKD